MHFDEIMKLLGEFGKFQKIRFFMVCLFSIVSAWHALNMVFVGASPDFHCNVADINLNGTSWEGISYEDRKRLFIPEADSCHMYDVTSVLRMSSSAPPYNVTSLGDVNLWQADMNRTVCQHGYTYSRDEYSETITTEFDLVCEQKFWKSTSKSIFFGGRLCGAVVFGQLSDRFGRRPLFFAGVVMLLVAGTVASFATSIYMFLPMYFCQGAAHTGAFLVAYTLSTELVGPRYRVVAGFVSQSFYSLGFMSLAGIAYLIRDWRSLELAITVPVVLFSVHYWFLPESVRWLLTKGRDAEAEKILQQAAKQNGVHLGKDVIEALKDDKSVQSTRTYSLIDCVRTKKMAKLSLNVWFNWLVNALVYYGLSLNTENLAGNPYLNFCLAGAVEIPAYATCILLLNKVGRRWPLIISMYAGGIVCILSGCIPTDNDSSMETLTVVLAMFGKMCITASYGIIYLMAAELFPTVIRNIGMGVASMSARIGGILAPLLLDLQVVSPPLPLVIFGSLSILAGSLAIMLPETAGKPLPQTPDDVNFDNGGLCCQEKSEDESLELPETGIKI